MMMSAGGGGKEVNRITVAFLSSSDFMGDVVETYSAFAQYPVASTLTVTIKGVVLESLESGSTSTRIKQGETIGSGSMLISRKIQARSVSVEPTEDDTYIYELEHPF